MNIWKKKSRKKSEQQDRASRKHPQLREVSKAMASGGKRRKNTQQQQQQQEAPPKHKSNLTHSLTTSTPPPIYTSFKKHLLFIPLIIMLLIAALFLLDILSNTFRAIGSRSTLKQNYVIEVVNEFPHDPGAFTQVVLVMSVYNLWICLY